MIPGQHPRGSVMSTRVEMSDLECGPGVRQASLHVMRGAGPYRQVGVRIGNEGEIAWFSKTAARAVAEAIRAVAEEP